MLHTFGCNPEIFGIVFQSPITRSLLPNLKEGHALMEQVGLKMVGEGITPIDLKFYYYEKFIGINLL